MDLAFSPTTVGVGAAELVELCVEAEGLGYRSAWLAEVAGPEAFALAGGVAAATTSMDLGVAVVPAATRSPTVLAMAAATVSQLAQGRTFALGVGASSRVIVERWHGADFDPPLQRVRDAVGAVQALLRGERDFTGPTSRVSRFRAETGPAGPTPVYVGALGPRMLRMAGEIADGVCLNLMPAAAVPRQLAEIRAGAEEAGRALPDGFGVLARFHVVPCDDPAEGRAFVRAAFGPYYAQPVYNRFLAWCGYPEEASEIAAGFASGDRDRVARALHDDLVDAIAPVGSPARIRSALEPFADAGIRTAALSLNAPSAAEVSSSLRSLAP
jgi:probable F420-dependent oxidoreductase